MNFPYTTLPGIPKDTKRPIIPVKFINKDKSTLPILCLVDSGADYSYLATEIAVFLGIDLSKVKPQKSFSINGSPLLGIGEVENLFNGIERGIDFFDCVAPTRRARNGSLYIFPNIYLISDKISFLPIKNQLTQGEILYHQLATYHNIYFITDLVKKIRERIKAGKFKYLKKCYGL